MTFWNYADVHPWAADGILLLTALTIMYVAEQLGGRRK